MARTRPKVRTKVRNPVAQQAWKRKAGPMTAPNAPKKGSQNWREHLADDDGMADEPGPCKCDIDCDHFSEDWYNDYQERMDAEEEYVYGNLNGDEDE